MTSVKLNFVPPQQAGSEGNLILRVVHSGKECSIESRYKIFEEEWDARAGLIRQPLFPPRRQRTVRLIAEAVRHELDRLNGVVRHLQGETRHFTVDEVAHRYRTAAEQSDIALFISGRIQHFRELGRVRSGECYRSLLNSLMLFSGGAPLSFEMLNDDLVEEFEAYLKARGLVRNSTSFYMRIFKTVYRLAIERGIVADCSPFRRVYSGIDKTVKRAISFDDVRKIKRLDLSRHPALDFARDMFIFSFCTRGMPFVDMAYLRQSDLHGDSVVYRRRKTGQLLTVEWIKPMQDIVSKYPANTTPFLLPIITKEGVDARLQYKNQSTKVNRMLKQVALMAGLSAPLTMYCARHSWASIARNKNIPLPVISEGLGHDSELTTRIYLSSIQSSVVDKANREVLRGL